MSAVTLQFFQLKLAILKGYKCKLLTDSCSKFMYIQKVLGGSF